jgi:hypothetical protein
MTAQQLMDFFIDLQNDGEVLSNIEINFRNDYDSDVIPLRHINEDLFDESNNRLVSISLMFREDEGVDENEND